MSVVHFLNVKEGDCNIIEHDSQRISVIDISGGNIPKEDVLAEDSYSLFSRAKGNFNQKEHPTNPIDYLKDVLKTDSIFRYIQTHRIII